MQSKLSKNMTVLLVLLCGVCLFGCAGHDTGKKVVFTTGFAKDEVFRINKDSCTLPEFMVYLTNMQNQYERVYGSEIWQKDLAGANLKHSIKENALARIAQIKVMNLLAEQRSISLTVQEQDLVKKAAQQYYTSLNETERGSLSVDEDVIRGIYEEYALANKLYHYIIKDVNPEISDDEARTITVQHILFKNYSLNGKGERVPLSKAEKQKVYDRALAVEKMAQSNIVFEQLIEQYSEDKIGTYSFRQGEMDPAFEKASFELGNGEISDVIEGKSGYHIIKCISTFDRDQTDLNKVKIVEERKNEVFNQVYDEFLVTLVKQLNQNLWDKITFIQDERVTTYNFFEIYEQLFETNQTNQTNQTN
ncbi:MAG: peptidylprolyl isomerase [Lachnospiraceae bacterium]